MCREISDAVQPWGSLASTVLLGKGYEVQGVNGLSGAWSLLSKWGPSSMHGPVTAGMAQETQKDLL